MSVSSDVRYPAAASTTARSWSERGSRLLAVRYQQGVDVAQSLATITC